MSDLVRTLEKRGACQPGLEWVRERVRLGWTPQNMWDGCPRGDWLLWWAAGSDNIDDRTLTLAACDCARAVLHLIHPPRVRERFRAALDAQASGAADTLGAMQDAERFARWYNLSIASEYAVDAAVSVATVHEDPGDVVNYAVSALVVTPRGCCDAGDANAQIADIVRRRIPEVPRG